MNNRDSSTSPEQPNSPITAHGARHDALQRLQVVIRFTASALFQSAALLLPVELKLLGSFMRLILPEHVTKGHASSTAFICCSEDNT